MSTNIPVLTYGTLRPGCHNYMLLQGATVVEQTVTLDGFDMFSNGGFPYVVDGTGTIEATLNYIDPECYDEVMNDLDNLEGFWFSGSTQNHYDRVLVTVQGVTGTDIQAYMYVARNPGVVARAKSMYQIQDGNWMSFLWMIQELRNREAVAV